MKTYHRYIAPVETNEGTAVMIRSYFDRELRLWTATAHDEDDYQVGEAAHDIDRASAERAVQAALVR
jgi:hypothetical protein